MADHSWGAFGPHIFLYDPVEATPSSYEAPADSIEEAARQWAFRQEAVETVEVPDAEVTALLNQVESDADEDRPVGCVCGAAGGIPHTVQCFNLRHGGSYG